MRMIVCWDGIRMNVKDTIAFTIGFTPCAWSMGIDHCIMQGHVHWIWSYLDCFWCSRRHASNVKCSLVVSVLCSNILTSSLLPASTLTILSFNRCHQLQDVDQNRLSQFTHLWWGWHGTSVRRSDVIQYFLGDHWIHPQGTMYDGQKGKCGKSYCFGGKLPSETNEWKFFQYLQYSGPNGAHDLTWQWENWGLFYNQSLLDSI